jgi:hypothetical protein
MKPSLVAAVASIAMGTATKSIPYANGPAIGA